MLREGRLGDGHARPQKHPSPRDGRRHAPRSARLRRSWLRCPCRKAVFMPGLSRSAVSSPPRTRRRRAGPDRCLRRFGGCHLSRRYPVATPWGSGADRRGPVRPTGASDAPPSRQRSWRPRRPPPGAAEASLPGRSPARIRAEIPGRSREATAAPRAPARRTPPRSRPFRRGLANRSVESLQSGHVRKILWPAGGSFVGDQVRSGDHPDGNAGNDALHPIPPCLVESHAVDGRQDGDSIRREANPIDDIGLRERRFGDPAARGSETCQRPPQPGGMAGVGRTHRSMSPVARGIPCPATA